MTRSAGPKRVRPPQSRRPGAGFAFYRGVLGFEFRRTWYNRSCKPGSQWARFLHGFIHFVRESKQAPRIECSRLASAVM